MKRRWVMVCVVVVAAAIITVALSWGEKEPKYKGKPLSYWIRRSHDSESEDREATEAVTHIGTNALPTLTSWIKHKLWIEKIPWGAGRFIPDRIAEHIFENGNEQRLLALGGFELLGSKAVPAIGELTNLLESVPSTTSTCAMMALIKIGEPALPALEEIMKDSRPEVRHLAVIMIGNFVELGTNELASMRLLITGLHDRDPWVAEPAAKLLRRYGDQGELVVGPLTDCLHSTNSNLRIAALGSLHYLGSTARSAAGAIMPLLNDPDPMIREEATNALLSVEPERLKTHK